MSQIRRRQLLISAGVLLAATLAARAQQARKVPWIGVLVVANPGPILVLVRDGLHRLGYVEGKNIQFDVRSADGKPDLLAGLAADLVRLKVDLIFAVLTPAVRAARQATSEIPIIMVAGAPVETGLISSLARPGGNITGVSLTAADLMGKILEIIREVLPSAKRVAVLANPTDPFTTPFLEQIRIASSALAIEISIFMIRGDQEFDAAFAEMAKQRANAVIVQGSLPFKSAIDFTLKYRIPSVSPVGMFPEAGGLISYAADVAEVYREAAVYVDKILKRAKPADLPVQQPTKYELVVNLKTAKALGLTIPKSILVRADRVIE